MPLASSAELIAAARSGQVISFPTDTVPGLAVMPDNAEQLYQIKGRSQQKPLILLGAQATELWPYVQGSAAEMNQWQALTQQHWPGALTLVLPASGKHPQAMTPADPRSLGIRVPNHPLAQKILAATGPLATTSANRSGEPAIQSLMAIAEQFPDIPVLDIHNPNDSGPSGQPSTVVAWSAGTWKVLRQGSIQI